MLGPGIEPQPAARQPDVLPTTRLSVSNIICCSAYYHLSRIDQIRHYLTTIVCKSLIHGLLTSRLDYGDAMLFGILLKQHTPKRCLRSSSALLLDVPRMHLERSCHRAFACAGPTLWNDLPTNLHVNDNHTQFKKL